MHLILNFERKKEKINETEFDVVKKFDELEKILKNQNKISAYLTIQEGCFKNHIKKIGTRIKKIFFRYFLFLKSFLK